MQVKGKFVLISTFHSTKRPQVYFQGIDLENGGQLSLSFPEDAGIEKFKPGEVIDLDVQVKPANYQGKLFLAVTKKN